jgi:TolB-like protein/Tfp pilus assembly protein PilF
MNRLKSVDLDLKNFKVLLHFHSNMDPLVLHFNKPSRKFYFSLIALITRRMKQQGTIRYIHIRRHEQILKRLDDMLAGNYASHTIDGMWEKIRKAWHYTLPNLAEASHFKIENRNRLTPYEKGGKHTYDCTENECTIWSNLFQFDEISNKWRFKFALDAVSLNLNDISLKFGKLRGESAWQEFISQYDVEPSRATLAKRNNHPAVQHGYYWLVLPALLLVTIVILSVSWHDPNVPPNPMSTLITAPDPPSIVVLPFVNSSADPNQEYFCDGITDEIISSLSRIPALRVISRSSSYAYKGKPVRVSKISRELGADYLLEGCIRKDGNRLRVTSRLIDATTDSPIWAERYDRELKDIFALQDDLTMQIVSKLGAEFSGADMSLLRGKGTTNIDAYLNYLHALHHRFRLTPEDNIKQREYLLEALELDPEFSSAYALLAHTHLLDLRYRTTNSRETSLNSAHALASKAIALDNRNPDAYLTLGWVNRHRRNHEKAIENSRKAVQFAPNYAFARTTLGIELMFADRLTEAIPVFEKAIRLDPNSLGHFWNIGETYRNLGQYKKALEYLTSAKQQQPNHFAVYLNLAACHVELGNNKQAQSAASKALQLKPDFSLDAWSDFLPYKNRDRVSKWIESLRKAGLPE